MLRNLCHKHGLTLLGKAKDVVGGDTLQIESANLPANMMKIESNVMRMKLLVEHFVQRNANDPDLQDLEPLELEPEIPPPKCETNPIEELSLRGEGISTVIHCTGYKLNFQDILDLPKLYDAQSYPIQERGAAWGTLAFFFSACRGCTSGSLEFSVVSPRTLRTLPSASWSVLH